MSMKLAAVRAYTVENRVVVVPRSWGAETVKVWQMKTEQRKIDDVRLLSLTDKREFSDGEMPVAQKIEMEDFRVDELPFELI